MIAIVDAVDVRWWWLYLCLGSACRQILVWSTTMSICSLTEFVAEKWRCDSLSLLLSLGTEAVGPLLISTLSTRNTYSNSSSMSTPMLSTCTTWSYQRSQQCHTPLHLLLLDEEVLCSSLLCSPLSVSWYCIPRSWLVKHGPTHHFFRHPRLHASSSSRRVKSLVRVLLLLLLSSIRHYNRSIDGIDCKLLIGGDEAILLPCNYLHRIVTMIMITLKKMKHPSWRLPMH